MDQGDRAAADIAIHWLKNRPNRPDPTEGLDIRMTGEPVSESAYSELLSLLFPEGVAGGEG